MSSRRWTHTAAIEFFTEQLVRQIAGRYAVRPQLPFTAGVRSEHEPDLAVTHKDPTRRMYPSELLLLIEIADSPRRADRGITLAIYAAAGVPECWIVDATGPSVAVYTQPASGSYASVRRLHDGDVLRPTLLPEVEIPIADIPR